jgi:site-specific DNA recombinase
MTAPRPCVLYARKSTDREDKQILSIPAQLRELREFAQRSGLTIVEELTESCSARKLGRPVFSKLLRSAQAGRVQRILAWRLDRLARNPVDGGQLIYLLGEGVLQELVTPEGSYTGAGDSKFMLSVLFGAATKMTDDLSAGVKRGNREVLKGGRIPWCPPMGYMKIRDRSGYRGAGKVVPDPDRFPLVQRIWKEMATGTVTVADVWRRAVNDWGLRTRETPNAPSTVPRPTTLYALLRNPFYTGLIRSPYGDFQGEHQAMITPEEFERVQHAIRQDDAPRPSKHNFLFSGLLHCGTCGRLLIGEQIVKPSGLVFTYYRCGRRRLGYDRCAEPAPREDAVLFDVERELAALALPENMAAWTREALDWWAAEQKGLAAERAQTVRSELEAAEKNLARLTDLLVAGLLAESDFITRREEAEARIAALRSELQQPDTAVAAWRTRVEEAITVGRKVSDVLTSTDPAVRRAFIAQVYENLVVTGRITKPCLRFPFTILADALKLSRTVGKRYENRLPPPKAVLNQRKSARRGNPRERALSTWWAKVEELRTPDLRTRPPNPRLGQVGCGVSW